MQNRMLLFILFIGVTSTNEIRDFEYQLEGKFELHVEAIFSAFVQE